VSVHAWNSFSTKPSPGSAFEYTFIFVPLWISTAKSLGVLLAFGGMLIALGLIY
jgi:hypothetical protein